MFAYQMFSIADTDHFIPTKFPQLEASIQKVIEQLAGEPPVKMEMVLSFVKNHSMNSDQVRDNPGLAALISNRSLPLQLMEALFEAARKNSVFKTELGEHIKTCFATKNQDHEKAQ